MDPTLERRFDSSLNVVVGDIWEFLSMWIIEGNLNVDLYFVLGDDSAWRLNSCARVR